VVFKINFSQKTKINNLFILIKLAQPIVNSDFFWNKTIEDYDFYLNLKNASVYSWTMPSTFLESPNLITRTILKVKLYFF
jgi:hypothetical protein